MYEMKYINSMINLDFQKLYIFHAPLRKYILILNLTHITRVANLETFPYGKIFSVETFMCEKALKPSQKTLIDKTYREY